MIVQNGETVFYAVYAMTVARQWFGKHISTTEAMFSVWSMQQLYSEIPRITNSANNRISYERQ
jgi:hypothetical protein